MYPEIFSVAQSTRKTYNQLIVNSHQIPIIKFDFIKFDFW